MALTAIPPTQPTAATAPPREKGGGNALRAAVLGVNDGLVSNFSLVMGVAGAAAGNHMLLLTGLAGTVAGSCSMAMGEWLSVNNARELTRRQIDDEVARVEQQPDAERRELVAIYQAKGLDPADAEALACRIFKVPEAAVDTLAREALGVDPEELGGSAWVAAASSFAMFAGGALVPVAPFLFLGGENAHRLSIALSALAMVAVGLVTARFTGRNPGFSTLRQLVVGLAAAGVTFAAGHVIGASIA